MDTGFHFEKPESVPVGMQYYFYPAALEAMKEIASICDEKGIRLIVFSSPMFSYQLKLSAQAGYLDFLEQLAAVTPYYNFSSLNSITSDEANYLDPSHYKAHIGDMILNRIFCEDKNVHKEDLFGEYVTQENVDDVLAALRVQLECYDEAL